MTAGKCPLEGIKVIDWGQIGVAPMTARYLADYGATVVRIESHTVPDAQRTMRPFKDNVPGLDRAAVFTWCNSSKLSVTLDLKNPEAADVKSRLARWADIMVSGFPAGTMEKLGLGYESVRRINPEVIYLTTCIGGQNGPLASFRAYGHQAAALAGVYELVGWPDRLPAGATLGYTDWISPRFGVAAIMAALDYRRRTGKGQLIDQSQLESGVHFIAPLVMDYAINGGLMERNGNRLPYAAPHGAYRCRGEDRWIAIAVFTDDDWKTFCRVIGEPAWTRDSRFATLKARKEHEDELDALVESWSRDYTAEHVMTLMQASGLCAGVVESVKDLFEDPQLKHRAHFRWFKHGVIGEHAYNNHAFRLSRTPDCQHAAPLMGEHNEQVLKELLGMDDDQVADLFARRVITTDADQPEF